jgi:hypothetical protein
MCALYDNKKQVDRVFFDFFRNVLGMSMHLNFFVVLFRCSVLLQVARSDFSEKCSVFIGWIVHRGAEAIIAYGARG